MHGRPQVNVRRVDECTTMHELITHCFPAFGGAFLRRIYTILDRAIGLGCPLTLSIAGPVTVSGQHQAWLIPLLETGWVAYVSTTDAACYHDGHRSLNAHREGPIFEVPIWGDDGALRDERTIRAQPHPRGCRRGLQLRQVRRLRRAAQRRDLRRRSR